VFGLGSGFEGEDLESFKRKVRLFGLRYITIDL